MQYNGSRKSSAVLEPAGQLSPVYSPPYAYSYIYCVTYAQARIATAKKKRLLQEARLAAVAPSHPGRPLYFNTIPEELLDNILRFLSLLPKAHTREKHIPLNDIQEIYWVNGVFGAFLNSRDSKHCACRILWTAFRNIWDTNGRKQRKLCYRPTI